MFKWHSVFDWGRRASDRVHPAPVAARDPQLERAIASEAIEVQYQPIIDPRTGGIVGAEALARSTLCASATLLFERASAARLDERLSRLVQRKALRSASRWTGSLAGLRLSINLLPADLANDGYEAWLLNEIDAAGIDPSRVTAEITESALLEDREAVAERLASLRSAGVSIAVDDFGTGYACLAYLTALPLDMLKIDRGLITDIVLRERDRIVVQAIVRLAHELGLKVLAEGVESTAQLALLSDWGCDLYQGFIGAGALTERELARFVAATTAKAA